MRMNAQVVEGSSAAGPALGSPRIATTRRQSTARLFGSLAQSIERLSTTRANSRAGLVCDSSVSVVLLFAGLRRTDASQLAALSMVLFGLVLFSLVEYCFHRWLFHGSVRIMEQGHRKHHEDPLGYDSLPFFCPRCGCWDWRAC